MNNSCPNCGRYHSDGYMTFIKYRGTTLRFGSQSCLDEYLDRLIDPAVHKVKANKGKCCTECGRDRDGRWKADTTTTVEGKVVFVTVSVRIRGELHEFCSDHCRDSWLDKLEDQSDNHSEG